MFYIFTSSIIPSMFLNLASDNFLSNITHCILANNDEPSPTEYKNEEDLEFGVCHETLLIDDRKIN